jgi:Tfp pilus assembly protein PilN
MPAKRDISLLPNREFNESSLGRLINWITTSGRYIVIFTELIVIGAFLSRFWLDRKNSDLSDEIRQGEAILESTSDFENEYRLLQSKLKFATTALAQDQETVNQLTILSQNLPSNVLFETLGFAKDQDDQPILRIKASSNSETDLVDFITNLTLETTIKTININSIEKSSRFTGYKFDLDIYFSSL